ncbi:FAD-binding oxidoreductase [Quadrisphaera setariae]|uniref:FAD-binding oxidoreductase n=1 Tax=Quadrisphaera setariae TaxID=2593304 RepID=UPI001C9C5BF6|nr:FAD-binding oxidoreductase [Quadrisphaera setariae]
MTDALPELPQLDSPRRRVPPTGAKRPWQTGTVTEVRQETPHAKTFRVQLEQWQPHLPGQNYLVRLTAPDGYRAQRSYSVASPPEDPGVVELTVDRLPDGEVSGYLHEHVAVGDPLEVRGPFGGWFVWRGDRPALLVGGGSGLVPLVCVLRSRAARLVAGRDSAPVHLVAAARTREELFYSGELTGAFADLTTAVLSREDDDASGRPAGRLRADDLLPAADRLGALRASGGPGADVFLCGSTPFTTAAEQLLVEVGVPAESIRVERFGPS